MDTPNTQTPAPMPPPTPASTDSNKTLMSILAYLGILVIIPLIANQKNDPFIKFHAKQGLVLLIIWVLGSVLFRIPFLGWLLWVGVVVLSIMGIINVVNNQMKELPVIGKLASNFKF